MRQKDIKIFQNFYEKSTVSQRFKMCFYKGDEHFSSLDNDSINDSYNYEKLIDILKENDLDVYSDLLINYQNNFFNYFEAESVVYKLQDEIHGIIIKENNYTSLLKFLLENNDSNWGIKINFTNSNGDKITIRDKDVSNMIYDAFKSFYISLEMNKRPFTFEEAKEYLENPGNFDELEVAYNKYYSIGTEDVQEYIDNYKIPTEVIQYFKENTLKECMINKEFLDFTSKELENSMKNIKPKVGRKIENIYNGELALDLSYLIRFQRFVLQDEYDNIYDMPILVKDLELIYKYFEFWGFENLKSKSSNEKNVSKELKSGYMNVSSWIEKYKKSRGKYFEGFVRNLNEIEIDKYRKIVRAEIE